MFCSVSPDRLWQNSLLDSPASQSEIWSWVQAVYGVQTNRWVLQQYNTSHNIFKSCALDLFPLPQSHTEVTLGLATLNIRS